MEAMIQCDKVGFFTDKNIITSCMNYDDQAMTTSNLQTLPRRNLLASDAAIRANVSKMGDDFRFEIDKVHLQGLSVKGPSPCCKAVFCS